MIHPIPGGGLLGDRPVVAGGRDRTAREEQLQRKVENDTAHGPVVKAKRAPSAPFGSWTCRVLRVVSILHCLQREK